MATNIAIPKLGVTVTEATITAWLVDDGASVAEGQALYSLATDKVESDIESPAAGTLRQIGVVDQTYPVGTVVGEIV